MMGLFCVIMALSQQIIHFFDRLENRMTVVIVSPKYQIVIPKAIREALELQPGQKVQVIRYQNRIELIPIRPMKKARGFLKGIDTSIDHEGDRL
jgi:AbrB family looped-hinge helix DNA binding protein